MKKYAKEKKEKKEKKPAAPQNKYGHREGTIWETWDALAAIGATLKEFVKTIGKKHDLDEKKAKNEFYRRARLFPASGYSIVMTFQPEENDNTLKIGKKVAS